jgi:hypothetical protein
MDSKYRCITPAMADFSSISDTKILCTAYIGNFERFAVTVDSSHSLTVVYRIQTAPEENFFMTAGTMQTATSIATSGVVTNYFNDNVAGFLRIEASATAQSTDTPLRVLIHGQLR